VVRCHERIASRRRNFCHHVSKLLVATYDLISFEKLKIQGMARTYLAKSILDAAWGILLGQIVYKAEEAGKWAVPVDPKGTTQLCSGCGATVPKTLAESEHRSRCGLLLGRDHNAALNILALGRSAAGLRPQESYKSNWDTTLDSSPGPLLD
jgi:putative transposase